MIALCVLMRRALDNYSRTNALRCFLALAAICLAVVSCNPSDNLVATYVCKSPSPLGARRELESAKSSTANQMTDAYKLELATAGEFTLMKGSTAGKKIPIASGTWLFQDGQILLRRTVAMDNSSPSILRDAPILKLVTSPDRRTLTPTGLWPEWPDMSNIVFTKQ